MVTKKETQKNWPRPLQQFLRALILSTIVGQTPLYVINP